MTEEISKSKTIPAFLEAVKAAYGIEVPTIVEDSPLWGIWKIPIAVAEGSLPEANYTATGSIRSEFPFSAVASPQPDLKVEAKIDVFEALPKTLNTSGIKATVFQVPISPAHPNGVIVKKGLTFVNQDGTLIPEESIVPPEAQP